MRKSAPSVTIIGAGMVGLSTAWYLQEEGAHVTVLEAQRPNAGASCGNAGWVAPGLTTPLPNPSVLRYGLTSVFNRRSPLFVPLRSPVGTWRWLASFARNCSPERTRRAQAVLSRLSEEALSAFDYMQQADANLRPAGRQPFLIVFTSRQGLAHALEELEGLRSFGQEVRFEVLAAHEVHQQQPGLSPRIHAGVRLHGQVHIDPTRFVASLAESVGARGGGVVSGVPVDSLHVDQDGAVATSGSRQWVADHVVVATGAALNRLAAPFGVRSRVQAGRGYSFSSIPSVPVGGPMYFPEQRIACTPLGDRLRVAGMMEFRPPEAPLDRQRLRVLTSSIETVFPAALTDLRQEEEWVGARPCTADGLPLLGPTAEPRVHVAGGHGMWGVALGPASGRLLARSIAGGIGLPPALAPLNPTR